MDAKQPFFPGNKPGTRDPNEGISQRDAFALVIIHALVSRPDIQLFEGQDAEVNVSPADIAQAAVTITDLYQTARGLT